MNCLLAQVPTLPDAFANLDLQKLEQLTFAFTQYGWLALTLVSSLSVWLYYRHRTYPPSQKTDTLFPRLCEGSLDSLVYWPLGYLIALLSLGRPPIIAAVLGVIGYLCWLAYHVIMHRRYGQTLGKMIAKVRVVDQRTGAPLTWRQAWLRQGVPILIAMLPALQEVFSAWGAPAEVAPPSLESLQSMAFSPFAALAWVLSIGWLLAEIVSVLATPDRRALHDLLAGTLVIRTNLEPDIPPPLPAATA